MVEQEQLVHMHGVACDVQLSFHHSLRLQELQYLLLGLLDADCALYAGFVEPRSSVVFGIPVVHSLEMILIGVDNNVRPLLGELGGAV